MIDDLKVGDFFAYEVTGGFNYYQVREFGSYALGAAPYRCVYVTGIKLVQGWHVGEYGHFFLGEKVHKVTPEEVLVVLLG